jgi:hypothetical protein
MWGRKEEREEEDSFIMGLKFFISLKIFWYKNLINFLLKNIFYQYF